MRRFDEWPRPVAFALGAGAGGVVGLTLELGGAVAVPAALGLAVAALYLGFTGRPVFARRPRFEVAAAAPERVDAAPEPAVVPAVRVETDRATTAKGAVDVRMLCLPGGEFIMGSPDSDPLALDREKPQHPVRVSPFAIMDVPVTEELFSMVTGSEMRSEEHASHPRTGVSWFDAAAFCALFSNKTGRRSPYAFSIGTEIIAPEDVFSLETQRALTVEWDRRADGYRLPTEAEHEYAMRAGTTTRWFWGEDEAGAARHAFTGRDTGPVRSRAANPWGLHDIAGNVWEWCWDWHAEYSPAAEDDPVPHDPSGPARPGVARVLRGGSFVVGPRWLRSAFRFDFGPVVRVFDFGFRCVRSLRQPGL
jgi:formylglycine-generating enzyme required for sulfatase activity